MFDCFFTLHAIFNFFVSFYILRMELEIIARVRNNNPFDTQNHSLLLLSNEDRQSKSNLLVINAVMPKTFFIWLQIWLMYNQSIIVKCDVSISLYPIIKLHRVPTNPMHIWIKKPCSWRKPTQSSKLFKDSTPTI